MSDGMATPGSRRASRIPERAVPLLHGTFFALFYALGMPGYDIPLFPFVCWIPFFILAESAANSRQAALRSFLAGTGANILLFYWIAYTVAVPGRIGWPAGCAAALLVSAYMGAYFSAAGFLVHRFHRRFGEKGLFLFPVAWTGLEFLRSVLFTGSPWVLYGYALTRSTLMIQAADIAGVFGLGFLLAASNVFLFRAWESWIRKDRRRGIALLSGAAGIALFLFSYGLFRTVEWGKPPSGPGLRVGIAQGGIDQTIKWNPAFQQSTIEIYARLSREAASKGAGAIIWPETAAPFFYWWEEDMSRQVERAASENGLPLIFGAPWFDPSGGGKYFNSVFHLDSLGILQGRYDKRHLVPFGEYIPLKSVLFFIRKMTEGGEDFSSGTEAALLSVAGGKAGASVCYEAVFPGIIRDSVLAGAQWLVNVTNDAWFGDTVAPRQHLAMARMRSVEFRRPMARAANSGISAFIDAKGDTVASLGLFRTGVIVGEIHAAKGETIYTKTGEFFAISCTIITFFILLISLRGSDGVRTAGRKIRRA